MDFNLHAYSTERLEALLVEKQNKTPTPLILEIIEAIKAELAARKSK